MMISIKEIAEQAGVSRTTVSNVIHGKTKKVSQETIDKITKIMAENHFVPTTISEEETESAPKIIGMIVYHRVHGMVATQDTFVGEILGTIEKEIRKKGYYLTLISAETSEEVLAVANAWNVHGLIALGYPEEAYKKLKKKLNKKMILIDFYPENGEDCLNIGVDDYDGGYQVGKYLYECGYKNALYLAEMDRGCDLHRWLGFKAAMEEQGEICSDDRYILIGKDQGVRRHQYEKRMDEFLACQALAFSSDYNAVEAMSIFSDFGYKVPDDLSIVGFDDNIYATLVRPKLTTVRQDVEEKGREVANLLLRMMDGEKITDLCIRNPVQLIKRDSVKDPNR